MPEANIIVQELIKTKRARSDNNLAALVEEMWPTSFNGPAFKAFQSTFHLLLSTCSKSMKEILNGSTDSIIIQRKALADGLLQRFVQTFRTLRLYDLCELVEKNEWVLNKICKMAISQSSYFNMFKALTKQHLNFVPDLQAKLRISVYNAITKFWMTPSLISLGTSMTPLN